MVSVFDVVKYILSKQKPITAMKLQKLAYYCQAWSLVWDERALFKEKIEAWSNGPVIRKLYDWHKGRYSINSVNCGDIVNLEDYQKDTINAVLKFYGDKSAQWLSDLTHNETPWQEARKEIPDKERGNTEISLASMEEYYSSISG